MREASPGYNRAMPFSSTARSNPPVSALLLDVMGTLVHDPFFEEVPRALGMTLEEIFEHKHPTAWIEFERGEIDEPTFFAKFFADGRAFDHEGMCRAMVGAYRLLEGIEPLLDELQRRAVPMHLLSNYPSWYQRIENKLALSRWAAWSFVSCNMGVRKPDPAIYQRAAITLAVPPAELLFVDDRESNCEGARKVGMQALRFESAEQLRAALVDRGVL